MSISLALRKQRLATRQMVNGRLVAVDAPTHNANIYKTWGCRCPICTVGNTKAVARYRNRKKDDGY